MSRNINNLVAIIPEWEFNKLNIKAYRRRLGNGVIINSKDLPNSTDKSFSMVIFKMGGIIMPMSEAERYIITKEAPIIFKEPNSIMEDPIIEKEIPEELSLKEEDEVTPEEDIKDEELITEIETTNELSTKVTEEETVDEDNESFINTLTTEVEQKDDSFNNSKIEETIKEKEVAEEVDIDSIQSIEDLEKAMNNNKEEEEV